MAFAGSLFGTQFTIHNVSPGFVSIPEGATFHEMLELADLDFNVQLYPVYDHRGREIEHVRAVHRTDTDELLGVVGTRYQPIENEMAFQPIARWMQSERIEVVRAGHFDRGRICSVIVRVTDPSQLLEGLDARPYLVMVNSFDGSHLLSAYLSIYVRETLVPVPAGYGTSQPLAVKHVSSFPVKLGVQMELPSLHLQTQQRLLEMSRLRITTAQIDQLALQLLIPEYRRTPERVQRFREKVLPDIHAAIAFHPVCLQQPELRERLLGFLLGFCYWVDADRCVKKNQVRGYYSALLGSGLELKERAMLACLAELEKAGYNLRIA